MILLFPILGNTQNPMIYSGATWEYDILNPTTGNPSGDLETYKYLGDSIVNNISYYTIRQRRLKKYFELQDSFFIQYERINLIEQNGYSLIRRGAANPFHDLDATIGDTLGYNLTMADSTYLILSKKDTVQLEGLSLRRNIIDVVCNGLVAYNFHMVERVGTVEGPHGYFSQWTSTGYCFNTTNSGDNFSFRRYYDDEIILNKYFPYPPSLNLLDLTVYHCVGDSVTATYQATDSINQILSYRWEFPNGVPTSSTDSIVEVVFSDLPVGYHKVYVETTNIYGTSRDSIYLYGVEQPVAQFDFTSDQNTYTFNNTTTPNSGITPNFIWDFGDNNGSTEDNPVHTYLQNGNYTVTLKANTGVQVFNEELCDTSYYEKQVNVVISSLDDISNNIVSISPNPSFGDFMIEGITTDLDQRNVAVVNHLGQVQNFNIQKSAEGYILSLTEKGFYFIKIKIDDRWITKRIITF